LFIFSSETNESCFLLVIATSAQEGRNSGAQQQHENFLIKSRLLRFIRIV